MDNVDRDSPMIPEAGSTTRRQRVKSRARRNRPWLFGGLACQNPGQNPRQAARVNRLAGERQLFDAPPAKIYGNIFESEQGTEKVFGYFQATNQTVSRIFTLRQDFPYPLNFTDCQGYLFCPDCLSVQNSSYDRPPWF